MSTDIAGWPKICPSCGNKISVPAARCWLCFTPLDRTDQTTTAPAPGEVRLSAPPHTQPNCATVVRLSAPPHTQPNCATVAVWVILTIFAAVVTFFLVCSAVVSVAFRGPMH